MKKKVGIIGLVALLMCVGGLAGCGGGNTPSPTPTPTPVEDYYMVSVEAATGISYTVNKTKAKKDENIVLTITAIEQSYSLKAVTMNGKALTESSKNVYEFAMPNRDAKIKISVSVTGEVVIDGDVAAVLNKDPETGIYVAKNILVTNGTNGYANINFKVGSTVLKALDFNEAISFGDIQLHTGKEYALRIATNCYYDFFYNPEKVEDAPCSIQRVGVEVLPNSVSSLSSMMICTYSVRSEPAVYTGDLKSISYEVFNIDGSDQKDYIDQTYTWQKYKGNKTYAKVIDRELSHDENEMYVYKDYDKENGVLSVVDTYKKYNNNLLANDDHYREDYNDNLAYSARYGIVEGDDYDVRRFHRNDNNATRMLNTSAHMPHYYLEREIMYAYRVGFEEVDELSSSKITINSVPENGGGFMTTLNSYAEYNSEQGIYTSEVHEAHVFDVTLKFDKRGALTSCNFKKTVFGEKEWDFVNHCKKEGIKGTVFKKINATYTYGEPTEELTKSIFDPEAYFIKSFDSMQIFNEKATKEKKESGKSIVQLSDYVYLSDGHNKNSNATFTYSPSTALDLWQYAPTSSTNNEVITKKASDLYYQMSAVGIGNTKLTFTNHLYDELGIGATYELDVAVETQSLIRGFYLWDDEEYNSSITTATPVNVAEGSSHSYQVVPETKYAPRIYKAISSDESLAKITSAPNAEYLEVTFAPSRKITTSEMVTISFTSDRYETPSTKVVFTFYVIPAGVNPVGVWAIKDQPAYPDTTITFTEEEYEGSVRTGFEGAYKGVIVDEIYNKDTQTGEYIYICTDTFYFYYIFQNNKVKAVVYDKDVQSDDNAYPISQYDYEILFYYDGASGAYGLFLGVYEDDYESGERYLVDYTQPYFGEVDTSEEPYGFTAFFPVI